MPRGVKTSKKKEYEIMVSYATTNSYNATANQVGTSDDTVKAVIERNQEEFRKIQKEKSEDFLNRANRIIDKMTNLLEKRVTRAIEKEEEIDETIDFISSISETSEDKDEKMTYKEKIALIRKLNTLAINSMNEITTSMGTLYDKARLADEKSTSINENKVDWTPLATLLKITPEEQKENND